MTTLSSTGPRTLTKPQFQATPSAKKGGTYEGYLAYIARRRAAKLAQPQQQADPFAPMSDASINQTINRFTGMYGSPMSDSQITSAAQGQIDPIIAAITGQINDRAKTSSDALSARYAAAAKELGGIDFGAPYASAKSEQAAVDSALQQSLGSTGGTALASDLSSRLGQINDPTVDAAASGLADRGAAIGTTELAHGSASLSNLIAQAAAAKDYGIKQPGIAKQAGLQEIAGIESQALNDTADAKTKLLELLPQIVQAYRSENSNLRSNKAGLAASLFGTLSGQNVTKATAKAGLVSDATKLGIQTQSMPDPSLSHQYGYAVDQYGSPVGGKITPLPGYHIDKNGNVVKDSKTTTAKPLTPKERQAAVDKIDEYYFGVPPKQQYDSGLHKFVDVPGTGVPAVDYRTAISNLMTIFGFSEQQATSLANTRYPPGVDGRPKSPQQVSTETKAREADARGGSLPGQTPTKPSRPKAPTAANPGHWGHWGSH